MNASSRMFYLVDEGNDEVIALQLLQRHLHFVALYWHPTISLSIGFQLKRSTRPIEECSSLPTACICKLSFPDSFRFGNISYWKQSLFAWCLSITRRPISCGWISAPSLGRCFSVPSGLWWFVARCGDHELDAACRADGECRAQDKFGCHHGGPFLHGQDNRPSRWPHATCKHAVSFERFGHPKSLLWPSPGRCRWWRRSTSGGHRSLEYRQADTVSSGATQKSAACGRSSLRRPQSEDQRLQADLRQSYRQKKAGNGEDRAISEADARHAPHVAPAGREPAIGRIEGHFPNGVGRRHKRTRPLLGFGL